MLAEKVTQTIDQKINQWVEKAKFLWKMMQKALKNKQEIRDMNLDWSY